MRVITWNCRRAGAHSPVWDYLRELAPDIALLQEVGCLPPRITDQYACLEQTPVRKSGQPHRFSSAILVRGAIGPRIPLRSSAAWVDAELQRFAGNLIAVTVQPEAGPPINVICVYSPAWPVDRQRLHGFDVTGVRLTLNRDVWVADLLWDALRHLQPAPSEPWLIAGDFNLCETFDAWKGGPRGNREYLDRMQQLGLVDCLRHAQGALTPTFRTLRSGTITAQIDYLFVTGCLLEQLVECRTGERERVFGGLSDHLPIVADFKTGPSRNP